MPEPVQQPQAEGRALIDTLANDGRLSTEQIHTVETGLRSRASDLGYNQEEIDAYFGKPAFTGTDRMKSYFTGLLDNVLGSDEEGTLSLSDAWRAGFQQSVSGLTINGKPPELTIRDNAPMVNRIAYQSAMLAGDFPAMVVGAGMGAGAAAVAGQAGPQAVIPEELVTVPALAMGGAFMLPGAMRESLMQGYEEGSIDSFGEFWDRLTGVALEAGKGFVTGYGAGKAGEVAKPGFKLAAELGTMVTIGAAMEGEVPEPRDFVDGAVLLFGAKGAAKVAEVGAKAARDVYAKTGKSPRQVIEDAKGDPTIPEDMLAKNMDVPRAYREATQVESSPAPATSPAPAKRTVTASEKAVLDRVSVGDKQGRPVNFDSLYTAMIDDLHPINQTVKAMAGGKDLKTVENAYQQARMARASSAKADHFLEYSPFKFDTFENVGKPLKSILEPVRDDLDGVRAYAVSRRAIELSDRPEPVATGIPVEAARDVVAKGQKKYGKVFEELVEYQDHVTRYLRDAGVISKDMFEAMRAANKDYVPFFRVMEAEGAKGVGKGLNPRQPIKRIKGSEREVVDPLESIIKNTYLYVTLAERNAVGRALVDLAEKSPLGAELVKKAPATSKPVRVTEGEIGKLLQTYEKELGVKLNPEELTVFRPNALQPKDNQIVVYREGKRQLFEVDPEVASAFRALDREQLNAVVRMLGAPARLLRAGSVLAPEFIARNPVRDQLSAFIFSEGGFKPVVDLGRGIFSLARKDADYQAWLKSGGPMSTLVSLDRLYLQKGIRDIAGKTGFMDAARNVVKSPVEMLRILSDLAEQGTRIGEFKRVAGKGRTKEDIQRGGFASREVTLDFARVGNKTRAVNSLVAFFNASVQGTDKMVRAFKDHPGRTTARIAASITLPSVMLHLVNRQEEDYYDLPQWQRDLFWNVKAGDTWYRIPKPFELGILFGTGAERTVDAILDRDPKAFDGFLDTLGRGMTPGYVPTVAVPVIEHFANRSLFTDRPIIPADREGLLPEYQHKPYTSELTKAMGKLVASVPGMKQAGIASPAVIDNYIRGWSGGLGVHVVNIADKALREAGVLPDPVKPAATLADMPFIKAFVVRHPSAGAEPIAKFYDRYVEYKKVADTVKKLTGDGEPEAALREMSLHNGVVVDLQDIRGALSQSMKFVRLIEKNPDIPPDEKRQLIDEAYRQMITIAKHGNSVLDVLDEAKEGRRPLYQER